MKNTRVESTRMISSGHCLVRVVQDNYSRKSPYHMTSQTIWEYTLTDMTIYDAYKNGSRSAEKHLIHLCKWWGYKTIERYA